MAVPLLDLKAQYAALREEMLRAVVGVLESQDLTNGKPVRELERRIAADHGCRAAVGVSSGTDALLCSLMTLGIGPGAEVITTPFTFFATAGSIWRAGARPVFVDIEPDTFNLDASRLAGVITDRTKAILPVHLYGQMADMEAILNVAKPRGLAVIEDAAQAIGASYKGHPAGTLGTAGSLSFYPTKNLGGLGDGGMILTQDEKLAERMRVLLNHGQSSEYHHAWVGGNFRLDSIQAAGLLVKLDHLAHWTARRQENARRYDELLAPCDAIVRPVVRAGNVSVFNWYVIRAPRRDAMKAFLAAAGIGTKIYYPLSLHQQPCFASLGYRPGDFPQSERAAAEVLALPVHPELTEAQLEYVAAKVREFYAGR
jgi:dTDP-4-amino-4,6-dideoxygalactose transaminase